MEDRALWPSLEFSLPLGAVSRQVSLALSTEHSHRRLLIYSSRGQRGAVARGAEAANNNNIVEKGCRLVNMNYHQAA